MTTRPQQQLLRRSLSYLSSLRSISSSSSSSIRPVSTIMISAPGSILSPSSCCDQWQQSQPELPLLPQLRSKFYKHYSTSATRLMQAIVHKDSLAAQPTEDEKNETDETIPVWANPRHVNDPDMKKMFPEDFESEEEMAEAMVPLPPLEESEDKVVAPPHLHQLAHEIVHGLNLLELRELTDKIADHFGFDDEMMAASYGGGGGGGAAAAGDGAAAAEEVVEAKTIFDLKLVSFDAKAKIKVIKEVRTIAGLGLKEAKELVESAPKVIQKDLKQEQADELKAQLEAVGAEIELV